MSLKRSINVAVVGMGNMGVPIARNLAFKSRSAFYLQIHSRSLVKAKEVCNNFALDGAQCAMRLHNQYSTVSKWSDVILTCLQDVHASRFALLEAPDSLIRHARTGQILIDHTTVDVETAKECAHECQRRGAYYIDAPLSGNPQSAANGQLTIMAGGEEEPFLKVLPMFRLYADNITRMGEAGTGSASKGICQMLVAIHTVAAAEAMSLAHQLGIEEYGKLISVLDASWGSSTMLRRNSPTMQKLLRNPEMPPPDSSTTVNSLLHDVGLFGWGSVLNGSKVMGTNCPLFHKAAHLFARASTAGIGDKDIAGVVHFLDAETEEGPVPLNQLGDLTPMTSAADDVPSSDSDAAEMDPQSNEEPVEFY